MLFSGLEKPMCGIAGIIDTGLGLSREEIARLVTAMRDSMVHRGPDDGATWVSDDGRVALAHRRLSIIDLRAEGRQPMTNEDGSVHVVFNGEIYNYIELADDLKRTRPHIAEQFTTVRSNEQARRANPRSAVRHARTC